VTDPDDLLVSVVVVNYEGAGHLPACLTAVAEQTLPRHQFEVIVVENASTDGSARLIRDRFPWCRLVASPTNLGFAAGNNLGLRSARGRWVALLNNDTVPDPFWLEELLRPLHQPTDAAVSKLVFARDPAVLNSAGLALLRDGRGADRGFRHADRGQYERTESAFAGCGAAVILPRPVAGKDLLDPRYFLYYEDLELGWRRRHAGQATTYAPRSLVRHAVGATAGESSPLFRFCVERNRALTSLRHGDLPLAFFAAVTLLAKVVVAWLLALRTRDFRTARATTAAAFSYARHAPVTLLKRWGGAA
jgi:GT2 family glycosyltransferase